MSNITEVGTFAMQVSNWKAALPGFLVVILSLPGWATAADDSKLVPVKLAADAPGMIRFGSCSRPIYPEQEAKNHQGMVTLRFLVGADGKVKKSFISTSSGYPAFDEAALVAISKCSFNPPIANGMPVDAWIPIRYYWKPQ